MGILLLRLSLSSLLLSIIFVEFNSWQWLFLMRIEMKLVLLHMVVLNQTQYLNHIHWISSQSLKCNENDGVIDHFMNENIQCVFTSFCLFLSVHQTHNGFHVFIPLHFHVIIVIYHFPTSSFQSVFEKIVFVKTNLTHSCVCFSFHSIEYWVFCFEI